MDVRKLLQQIINEISSDYKDFKFPISGWEGGDFLNSAEYYKWLSFYIKKYKPKRCLELGRRHGNSLYAMAYFLPDECILDSFDIYDMGNTVNKRNVNVLVYDGDFSKIDLSIYDFIFVDINGRGSLELEFHKQLKKQKFKGICAWDDTGNEWCPDEFFWDKIEPEFEKCKAPFHGNCFGFIYYK
jgi:hypothetical protein